MKLIDWLENTNLTPLRIVVWSEDQENEEEPLYEGHIFNMPWDIASAKLSKKREFFPPIEYRSSLGEKHNNEPGLCVIVKDH